MTNSNLQHQVAHYITHAREMLQVAQANYQDGFYSSAINRAYYAIFYTASALLLTKGETRSKHFGVISAFRQLFIKTDLLETEYSDIYGDALDARTDSDYDMAYVADAPTAHAIIRNAQKFLDRALTYLSSIGINV